MKDVKIKIINPLMGSTIPLPEYETPGSAEPGVSYSGKGIVEPIRGLIILIFTSFKI